MKQTTIRFNLDGLEKLKKAVGNTYTTRVGILGAHAARSEKGSPLNNAELGVIHMFGSVVNNIPPRDFLLMPIQKNSRELVQSLASPAAKSAFRRGDYKGMFKLLGIKAEEFIQTAFATGGFGQWEPNKPATIKAKGSSAPLIDTGQLRRAISSDVVKRGQATTPINAPIGGAP